MLLRNQTGKGLAEAYGGAAHKIWSEQDNSKGTNLID
jgi:hypothetical protein